MLETELCHVLLEDQEGLISTLCMYFVFLHLFIASYFIRFIPKLSYEDGGQLTEQVRERPYSVILFYEVEKAYPSVLDVFLQLLDDGVLTDGKGQKVDFKNTIVIMTSNIGAEHLIAGIHGEITMKDAGDLLMKEVCS